MTANKVDIKKEDGDKVHNIVNTAAPLFKALTMVGGYLS